MSDASLSHAVPGAASPGRRLKLLMVVHDVHARGGMEVQLSHLAAGLAASGHDIRLASIRSRTGAEAPGFDRRVKIAHLGAAGRRGKVGSLPRLARLARACDAVHCTGWDASLLGTSRRDRGSASGRGHRAFGGARAPGLALRRRSRPVDRPAQPRAGSLHGGDHRLRGVAARHADGRGRRRPQAHLHPEWSSGPDAPQPGGAGLDTRTARDPVRGQGVGARRAFVPLKRQLLALETTARLRDDLGDVRIVFAGGGPELDRVRRAAESLRADWAIFLGEHDNVPSIFALADLPRCRPSGRRCRWS